MRFFFVLGLLACRSETTSTEKVENQEVLIDADGDGYPLQEDCDDSRAEIYPGAEEICDGIDNNCDEQIDEGVTTSFYADSDGDGFGNPEIVTASCAVPDGFVSNGSDCDDSSVDSYPSAEELCDGADNDCDGEIDEDLDQIFYIDEDGDGFGDADQEVFGCIADLGLSTIAGDCDDSDPAVSPFANEVCDEVDNNCDGNIDEGVGLIFYHDTDNDGYGDPNITTEACSAPEGYVANSLDCDDTDTQISPLADEYCDEVDNDCDGTIDEDFSLDALTFYADTDNDGYGDALNTTKACSLPIGYVANQLDCDDNNNTISPANFEVCDGIDNNCDGNIDESGLDAPQWYADSDNDGYGDASVSMFSCAQPAGYLADSSDCDDNDNDVYPGAPELCNNEDDNCNGSIDDGAVDARSWYTDNDGDGYGDTATLVEACTGTTQQVEFAGDCDDSNDAVYPTADELCDGFDNDCDGTVDLGAIDMTIWYEDGDEDGYGDPNTSVESCDAPAGYAAIGGDCNDNNDSISPGAAETCDNIDQDCNGSIDDSPTDGTLWYIDTDGDGFGHSATSQIACMQPTGYVANDTDCDDQSNTVYPQATEYCNTIDDNCDGNIDEGVLTQWYMDMDGDGYGDSAASVESCVAVNNSVALAGDCDDNNGDVNPGAAEICDEVDNNCDGDIDVGAVNSQTFYADSDGDGYGDLSSSMSACAAPSGYVDDMSDCDDGDATISPASSDTCDGVDRDCDGVASITSCEDCLDIRNNDSSSLDGIYSIDPLGSGSYDVYCDMTTDGGGWTMVANLSDDGSDVWSQFMPSQSTGLWEDTSTYGSLGFTADYKSQAYMDVTATDILIKEAEVNVLYTTGCWSAQSFQSFLSGLSWSGDGSDTNWSDSTGAYLCDFTHFGYNDSVLRATNHSGSDRVLGFKWGERNGVQDGNKDRTMITTNFANGNNHHVDSPTGLGGFTSYGSSENYEDVNECQGDGPDQCSNSNQNYQLFVR